MRQITWRAPEDLASRLQVVAAEQGRSMNDYMTAVLSAALDPDLAPPGIDQVRERLARAGLLAPSGPPRPRPDPVAVDAARRRAGRGTPLSEHVNQGRE